jgi:hypothetical protein
MWFGDEHANPMPLRKWPEFPKILHVSAGSPARNGAVTDLSRSSPPFLVALRLSVESQLVTIQRLGNSLFNFRFGIAHATRRVS